MFALYVAGTIVERWYGSLRFLAIYLACAAAGSTASLVFGSGGPIDRRLGRDHGLVRRPAGCRADPPSGRPRGPGDGQPPGHLHRHHPRLRVHLRRRGRQRGARRRARRRACGSARSCHRPTSRRCPRCGDSRTGRGRRRVAPPRRGTSWRWASPSWVSSWSRGVAIGTSGRNVVPDPTQVGGRASDGVALAQSVGGSVVVSSGAASRPAAVSVSSGGGSGAATAASTEK